MTRDRSQTRDAADAAGGCAALAEIFRASIEELSADDYSATQRKRGRRPPMMRKNLVRACPPNYAGRDPSRRSHRVCFARRQ